MLGLFEQKLGLQKHFSVFLSKNWDFLSILQN